MSRFSLDPRMKQERNRALLLAALFLALLGIVGEDDYQVAKAMERPLELTAKEAALADFYTRHGAPEPVALAKATAKLKRPRLAAAQAVVESNGNPDAIGKAGEKGVWQIIEREWGVVPLSLQLQAEQYEKIMESLIAEQRGRLLPALSKYNSGHPTRSANYASRVMGLVNEVRL